ncbi:hypothetical protein VIGAN_05259600 [Vigna angularis var. angularis]|uniref:Uncharacterized protein n=1 Tax=Vigna angularis var. angularis TaxID=157739 RepID=A0A0S3S812_PHAAN|nr:hypothetical protein VIGAN_05259600 [Vigna angularis var. angularis]
MTTHHFLYFPNTHTLLDIAVSWMVLLPFEERKSCCSSSFKLDRDACYLNQEQLLAAVILLQVLRGCWMGWRTESGC